ncbi:MAG: hypothetical protein U1E65_09325 [Myxococcota bacterium]
MLPPILGLLLTASPPLLYVEEASIESPELAASARRAVQSAVTRATGERALLVDHDPSCGDPEPCASRAATERGSDRVVLVRFLGALTKIRVVLSPLLDGARQPARTLDLAGAPDGWALSLEPTMVELFPSLSVSSGAPRWIPMVIAGTGGAALAGAMTFGLLSRSARGDLKNASGSSTLEIADRADAEALAANVLLATGSAFVLTGLAWLALGSSP